VKRILAIYLAVLMTGCVTPQVKPEPSLMQAVSPCPRAELSGRGVALIGSDLQESVAEAHLEALADLLEANQDTLVSLYSRLSVDAVGRFNGESFARSFRKEIKIRSLPTVLKAKKFKDEVQGDYIISHVCMTRPEFERSVKESETYRENRFISAVDHYKYGMKIRHRDRVEALKWFTLSRAMVEEIGAQDRFYVDKSGERIVLYNALEREIIRLEEEERARRAQGFKLDKRHLIDGMKMVSWGIVIGVLILGGGMFISAVAAHNTF
jgi:hypothetical protein